MNLDFRRALAWTLTAVVIFSVLAGGAHDLWAATIVHLVVLAALIALLWASRREGGGLELDPSLLTAMAGVVAAFSLSYLGSARPEESRIALLDWISALFVFVVAKSVFRDERARDRLLAAVAILACVESAVILRQHWVLAVVSDAPAGLKDAVLHFVSMQPPGTLVNSSAAAAFFVLWFAVFAGLAWRQRRRAEPVPFFWTLGGVACAAGILLLDSHWGMICLLVSLPLLGGPRPALDWIRQRPRAAAWIAAAGACLFPFFLACKLGQTHRMNGGAMYPGENLWRLEWWMSGLKMFAAYPWFGIGLGNYPSAYLSFKVGIGQSTLYPHNILIGLLAETGLVGVGSLTIFLGLILKRWFRDQPSFVASWPFFLGLAAFVFYGMVGLAGEYLANLLCAGVILGALSATPDRPIWTPRLSVLIVATAAAIGASAFLVSPWMASRYSVEGERLLVVGDEAGALRAFSFAIELDALSSQARRGRARALLIRYARTGDSGDVNEATRRQIEACVLDRLNGELRWELANLLRAQNRRGEALANYAAAARLNPSSLRLREAFESYRDSR